MVVYRVKVLRKRSERLERKRMQSYKVHSERLSAFEEMLNDIYTVCRPKPSDYEVRRDLVCVFNEIAKDIYGRSRNVPVVEEFGSFVMDLFHSKSDLDLSVNFDNSSVEISHEKKIQTLRKFARKLYALQRCGHVSGVHPITTAKVPILKVIDCGTKVECDISVENRDGVSKSKIIYLICSLDERFHKLSFLMKAWAKAQNINSSKDKTLNSLSIILLVAFHLQTRNPPILPPFSAILEDGSDPDAVAKSLNKFVNYGKKNKESVAELLVTLLIKLLSVEKLWAKGLCASTYEAAWLSKTWDSKVCCISVEDFTDRSQNVARAVGKGEVKRIYKCIQHTSEYISAFMDGLVEIPTLRSHLFGRLAPFQVGSQTRNIEENGHTIPLPCRDINNKDDQNTESEKQSQEAIPSEPIMTKRKWSTEGWEGLPSEPSVTKRKWSTEGWEGLSSASWGQSKEDGVPPDSPWTKRQRSDETPEGTAAQWSRKSDTKGWFGNKHANKCAPVAKWANMQTGGRGESQESTEEGWEGLPSASWGQSKEDGVPLDSLWSKKKRSEETPEGTSAQWSRKSDTKGWSRKKHAKKCAPAPKWQNLQTGGKGESQESTEGGWGGR